MNDEPWERVSCLYDMEPDGKQWFYKTSIISGIILGFGNDVYGRALKDGDTIEVTYLRHNGEDGNIDTSENVKFAFVKSIRDTSGKQVDGNAMFNITLATPDSVTSGTYSESTDQVKQMTGYTSRALVLASPEHYKAFINRFSFCGYNRTWSEPGSLIVSSLIMRNYKSQLADGLDYFNLTEKDFYLTDAQKDSVIRCITNSGRQMAGVTYNIFNPEIAKYALYIYIKPKSSTYDKDYISNKIRKVVGEFFSNLNSDIYVPKSDIVQVIKAECPEIDGINMYFLSEANETAIKTGRYVEKKSVFDPSTGTYKKTETEVRLYDGEDPGLGLDEHGDIFLDSDDQYPVLMGGWSYISSKDREELTTITDPLIITFE